MSEIKECPFCGAVPSIDDPATFENCPVTDWAALVCPTCDCSGPAVFTKGQSTEEWQRLAIAAWNTRGITATASESPPQPLQKIRFTSLVAVTGAEVSDTPEQSAGQPNIKGA
jgi:hypothetical protein